MGQGCPENHWKQFAASLGALSLIDTDYRSNKLMNKNTLFKVSLLLVVFVAVAGCRKKPKGLTQIPGSEGAIVGSGNPAGLMEGYDGSVLGGGGLLSGDLYPEGSDVAFSDSEGNGQSALPNRVSMAGTREDRDTLASYTVYFDYDRYSIPTKELAKVEAVADYLNEESDSMVKIEGHCDERGTEEYNRALGERRALSVREVLVRLGVAADRVTTESWGEDRPAVEGETESAYSENRRGEFVLLRR
ncbi:MAG: Peptidoglycan-associated lipoprotein [Verrucomicrobia subdivision 3 bacterium]|nr:Peptidoglycan-associated lipoprotein [Limisphaerales bacterium]MCS1413842.1 Peptidoglycan-associated lipoprotein [Limisphaerales bacterium]